MDTGAVVSSIIAAVLPPAFTLLLNRPAREELLLAVGAPRRMRQGSAVNARSVGFSSDGNALLDPYETVIGVRVASRRDVGKERFQEDKPILFEITPDPLVVRSPNRLATAVEQDRIGLGPGLKVVSATEVRANMRRREHLIHGIGATTSVLLPVVVIVTLLAGMAGLSMITAPLLIAILWLALTPAMLLGVLFYLQARDRKRYGLSECPDETGSA
jgi:hypothetical protein